MTVNSLNAGGVAGIYTIECVLAGTNIVTQSLTKKNMITDHGLDLMMSDGNFLLNEVCVSSDSVNVTNQTLDIGVIVASTTNRTSDTTGIDNTGYFYWRRITWTFSPGAATGNLSKVGVRPNSGDGFLSVAKFIDASGNPTTISPQPNEQLQITYEYRIYVNINDQVFNNVNFGSIGTRTITMRPALFTNSAYLGQTAYALRKFGDLWNIDGVNSAYFFDGQISNINASPTGSQSNQLTVNYSNPSYTAGTFVKNFIISAGPGSGELSNGISSFRLDTTWGSWQGQFDTPVPKPPGGTRLINLTIPLTIGRQ